MADEVYGPPAVVVVGSGPAGLAAARAFREQEADYPLTMLTADPYLPYARPPLTKDYLRGDSERDDLWLTEPGWFDQQRITVRTGTPVQRLRLEQRQVILATGTEIPYRQAILATGSTPTRLPVPGGDDPALVYVRDLDSGQRLRALAERPQQTVAVIGSGFIGCEAAASLAVRGVRVVLVSQETVPHARRLGAAAGRQVLSWLTALGVDTRLGVPLTRIDRQGDAFDLELGDSRRLTVSAVVVGGGAEPDLSVAERSGLAIDSGAVTVDASMRSSAADVFAVGDIAYAEHPAAGRAIRVEHWGDAEQHGAIAGAGAAGASARWTEPPGFWSTIAEQTLKYSAWGDGFDSCTMVGDADRWSVWYRRGDELCGVLTHDDDEAYEHGQRLLARGAAFDEVDL